MAIARVSEVVRVRITVEVKDTRLNMTNRVSLRLGEDSRKVKQEHYELEKTRQ